jgi:hypothetical protein
VGENFQKGSTQVYPDRATIKKMPEGDWSIDHIEALRREDEQRWKRRSEEQEAWRREQCERDKVLDERIARIVEDIHKLVATMQTGRPSSKP